MKRFAMVAVLSTCFLGLSACQTTKRAVEALRPDKTNPERFICEPAGTRPQIPAEHVIDWSQVTTVQRAKSEHDAYVKTVRTREGVVAGYIVTLEGKHFACFNNMQWQRDFYAGLPEPER